MLRASPWITLLGLLATSGCINQHPLPCAGVSVEESGQTFCVIIEKGFLDAECPDQAPARHAFPDALVCAPRGATPAQAAAAREAALPPAPDRGTDSAVPPPDAGIDLPPGPGLHADIGPEPDAGPTRTDAAPDAAMAPAPSPEPSTRHSLCAEAIPPDVAPFQSYNRVAGDDRPLFDTWRDFDCDALPVNPRGLWAPCGGPGDAECRGLCLRGEAAGARGVCVTADVDLWCDGEGEVIGFQDAACWTCAPLEAHARACCDGMPGFDCRAWPYPSDGPAGSPCARHADCEPGLLCSTHRGEGYGICACPEDLGTDIVPGDECWR